MVKLFPHQQKAVEELDNGKVLWGDVGTGKTLTAMAYYMAREAPKDVYVITTAKKRDSLDWETEAARYGVSKYEGATTEGLLHVDSYNNLEKYTDVENAFFIFDEQRLVGTGKWTKWFLKIAKKNNWILLTATPGDVWLDYAPIFIANGWYKNITDFRDQHVVYDYSRKFPKVKFYRGEARLYKLRDRVLVEMPYLRHTNRIEVDVDVEYDQALFETVVNKKWHPFEERPIRDAAELFHVMRKVVNSDASRIEHVKRLLKRHPKLIVFYNFDYELEQLREGLTEWHDLCGSNQIPTSNQSSTNRTPGSNTSLQNSTGTAVSTSSKQTPSSIPDGPSSGKCLTNSSTISQQTSTLLSTTNGSRDTTTLAEWNGHRHQPIPDTESWVYLVQYTAGAEGWNCIETDAMVFYSLTYSYKLFHQAKGRIDRLNTPYKDLYYYVLQSRSMIDKAVRMSLRSKKSFNESAFLADTRMIL